MSPNCVVIVCVSCFKLVSDPVCVKTRGRHEQSCEVSLGTCLPKTSAFVLRVTRASYWTLWIHLTGNRSSCKTNEHPKQPDVKHVWLNYVIEEVKPKTCGDFVSVSLWYLTVYKETFAVRLQAAGTVGGSVGSVGSVPDGGGELGCVVWQHADGSFILSL